MKQANAVIRKEIESNKEFFSSLRRSDFSHQVKGCMHRQGISITDVSERLGVSPANLSRMLNGRQNITLDNIYALADALEERLILALESSLKGTSWINELSAVHQAQENIWKEFSEAPFLKSYSHCDAFSSQAANDGTPDVKSRSNWDIITTDSYLNTENTECNENQKSRVYA